MLEVKWSYTWCCLYSYFWFSVMWIGYTWANSVNKGLNVKKPNLVSRALNLRKKMCISLNFFILFPGVLRSFGGTSSRIQSMYSLFFTSASHELQDSFGGFHSRRAPVNISDLLLPYITSRSLRSSDQGLQVVIMHWELWLWHWDTVPTDIQSELSFDAFKKQP